MAEGKEEVPVSSASSAASATATAGAAGGTATHVVTVLFFAKARDATRTGEAAVEVPVGATAADLAQVLQARFPALKEVLPTASLAVNQDYASADTVIPKKAEVAVIPPVSGGFRAPHPRTAAAMSGKSEEEAAAVEAAVSGPPSIVELTHEVLDLGAIVASVATPKAGATSTFLGTTRDNFDGRGVVRLEYEAYEGMAKKHLLGLIAECRTTYPVLGVAIHHRLGVVPVTEASVIIAVASVHRAEGLEAVRFLIDKLKEATPIWKKEVYDDDDATWKANANAATPTFDVVDGP